MSWKNRSWKGHFQVDFMIDVKLESFTNLVTDFLRISEVDDTCWIIGTWTVSVLQVLPEVFCKKTILKIIWKVHNKTTTPVSFSMKLEADCLQLETTESVLTFWFGDIFQSKSFTKHLTTAASNKKKDTNQRLFLKNIHQVAGEISELISKT